jgi:hypothetical protein
MKLRLVAQVFWSVALASVCTIAQASAKEWTFELSHAPGPPDNPLKGLVPYAGEGRQRFPHSMEFSYLPLDQIVVGEDRYDWTVLDRLLDSASSRGNQTIFRCYMEYPGEKSAIPRYLIEDGVQLHSWVYEGRHPMVTPDYGDPRVREMLVRAITALGRRYDGDPRIGFLPAGLLGLWGEWHNWPREDLFAPPSTQKAVLDAYEKAFSATPVLLRYPAGAHDPMYVANAGRPFGYHDDSFAWATLDTGRPGDAWYFVTRLRAAHAASQWKQRPIGGEIRPEAWGRVFDVPQADKRIQDFQACVRVTHASWLMDSGMFRQSADLQPPERRARALQWVAGLGYDFHVPRVFVRLSLAKVLTLELAVENRGVAPFYLPWRAEYALLDRSGNLQILRSRNRLNHILPGDRSVVWRETWRVGDVPPGRYRLLLRGANPMRSGKAVRFANSSQDKDRVGWLTLGEIRL